MSKLCEYCAIKNMTIKPPKTKKLVIQSNLTVGIINQSYSTKSLSEKLIRVQKTKSTIYNNKLKRMTSLICDSSTFNGSRRQDSPVDMSATAFDIDRRMLRSAVWQRRIGCNILSKTTAQTTERGSI